MWIVTNKQAVCTAVPETTSAEDNSLRIGSTVELLKHNQWTKKEGLTVGHYYTVKSVTVLREGVCIRLLGTNFMYPSQLFEVVD